jgi:hypothetical protein
MAKKCWVIEGLRAKLSLEHKQAVKVGCSSMRRVVRDLVLISLLSVISGCDIARDREPGILVIAVEGLSFEALSCDVEELGGLKAFCEESVRFSHAFSPSSMSQATMASLLTGLYPFDHGVRNNGDDFLSAKFRTLAEGALSRNYHTLFVSGGPPIWRKSGLAQGFEVFDDTMDLSPGTYYRPAEEVFRLFEHWSGEEQDGRPQFSFLFLADLQFPEIATHDDEGEVRELSPDAQKQEILESLEGLVEWLKNKKRWNSTHVVLVGLNTLSDHNLKGEPTPLSLRSAATQVTLFIKPARKERDNVIQWAVDRNVSLVDVGYTMFGWLGLEPPRSSLPELQPQSLANALTEAEPNWDENRMVLSETAWPDWLEGAGIRWAIRQNQFLYIHDKKPLVFNTLTDRLESLPLKINDPLWTSLNGDIIGLLQRSKVPAFGGMGTHWPDRILRAKELFRDELVNEPSESDRTWNRWYLRLALAQHKWKNVKKYAQEIGDPVGVYIASKHLNEFSPLPKNPCVRLMLATKGDRKSWQSECEDERVLALYNWQSARNDEDRNQAQERFLRIQGQTFMDDEIGRLNYLNDLRWDVNRQIPDSPQMVDYLLTLKEFEPFNKKLAGFLGTKNARF